MFGTVISQLCNYQPLTLCKIAIIWSLMVIISANRAFFNIQAGGGANAPQSPLVPSDVTTMGSDRENPGAPNLNGPNGGPQA
jgi:hypothetical protein